ncbi:MAG TPA: hypothetical protein VGI81_02780 [Tepidisphaeraceae bacterium]
MIRSKLLLVGLLALAANTGHGGDADDAVLFRDTFQGKLADGWSWRHEAPGDWRIGDRGLEVHVLPGTMWGPANDAKNLLMRRPPDDPQRRTLEVTASVWNHPTNQYEQVDLTWYFDDSNMVKVGEERVDGKLSVVMGREQGDRTRTVSITPLDSEAVQLRYRVKGNQVRGFVKTPKGEWREVGHCDAPAAKGDPHICLQFYQGAKGGDHWARVSDVTVRSVGE